MKAERKYMMHHLDAAFDLTYTNTNYVRLGKDLEEFTVELNPDVSTSKNILGENSVVHAGYEASSDTDPYYYDYDDSLSEKIMEIAMNRYTGDACRTSYVESIWKPGSTAEEAPTLVTAWREDVLVIPTSYGGDTSGVQVPFTINYAGNRKHGTFDLTSQKFTPSDASL